MQELLYIEYNKNYTQIKITLTQASFPEMGSFLKLKKRGLWITHLRVVQIFIESSLKIQLLKLLLK